MGEANSVVRWNFPSGLHLIQSWDMAFKDTRDSDFVVGQIQAAHGADRYLLDQIRDRLDLPGTLLAVRRLSVISVF
jgi:phage terminase large subunit-like protein